MGNTLFAAFRLFDPLQQAVGSLGRLLRRAPPAAGARRQAVSAPPRFAADGSAPCAAVRARPPRCLRVVRVFEGSQSAPSAGRMVISGRMADVCAELERLAALEATAS